MAAAGAAALSLCLLAGCGGNADSQTPQEPQEKDVDLTALYGEVEENTWGQEEWGKDYMADIEGELLEQYYPGLSEVATKQLVAKTPLMSAVVNEVVFVQCETEEDAAKVMEIFQERIDYQVGDETTPGGAWYPESIESWESAQTVQKGTYAALVASSEYQDQILEIFNGAFA